MALLDKGQTVPAGTTTKVKKVGVGWQLVQEKLAVGGYIQAYGFAKIGLGVGFVVITGAT